MSKKKTIHVILSGAATLVLLLGLSACNTQEKVDENAAPPAQEMQQAVVTSISVTQVPVFYSGMKENGTIEAVEQVTVQSKISGRLEKILVHEGDVVEVGQLVAVVEHKSIQAELESAKAELDVTVAELEQAQVGLADAQNEVDRYEKLFKDGYCTEQQLTQRRTTLRTAQAAVAVSKANIAKNKAAIGEIQVDLDEATIEAPIAGVISDDFSHTPGEMINGETPIVEVVSTDRLYARVNVAEQYSHRITQGMTAFISLMGDKKGPYQGKVWRIQPTVDTATRTTRVDVLADDPSAMRPGMFATVFFAEEKMDNPTVLPASALKEENGGHFIWLIQGSQAKRLSVTPGLKNGNEAAITDTLPEGARVLISGTDNLKDGDQVVESQAQAKTTS
ncbi:MAG: efflux RND transporter periplasmic adaptor subunit [Desulfatibacillum sp.]|nr:efflux RND transporter periplasmic adaptor subunit [Desulfatibacillum sp.]